MALVIIFSWFGVIIVARLGIKVNRKLTFWARRFELRTRAQREFTKNALRAFFREISADYQAQASQ